MALRIKVKMKPSGRTISYQDAAAYGGKLVGRLKKRDKDYVDQELRRLGIPDPNYFRQRWGDETFRIRTFPSEADHLIECIPMVEGVEVVSIGFCLPPYIFEMFNEDQDGVRRV